MQNLNGFQAAASVSDRLLSLQALRAIAAILVTIAHASEEAKYFFGFKPLFETDPFGKGVDLFFVISGFIIYYASKAGSPAARQTPIQFIINRFIRVAPLYYIFTTLMVLVVIFLPSGVKEAKYDFYQIISSYFFWPYARELDGRVAPILSLGWTLNYELFFYFIFSLCLSLNVRNTAFLSAFIISLLAIIGVFVPDTAPAPIREWTHNIIIEFSFGIIIAYIYEEYGRFQTSSAWIALPLIGSGFLLLYFLNLQPKPFNIPRFISAGIPSAIIVFATVVMLPVRFEPVIPHWLTALGDSSYSLYVSHRFIQRPIQILFNYYGVAKLEYAGSLYVLCAVLAACTAGHIVFLYLERPLHQYLKYKFSHIGKIKK